MKHNIKNELKKLDILNYSKRTGQFKEIAEKNECILCLKNLKDPVQFKCDGFHNTGLSHFDKYNFCSEKCITQFKRYITWCGVCYCAMYKKDAYKNEKFGDVCSEKCSCEDNIIK